MLRMQQKKEWNEDLNRWVQPGALQDVAFDQHHSIFRGPGYAEISQPKLVANPDGLWCYVSCESCGHRSALVLDWDEVAHAAVADESSRYAHEGAVWEFQGGTWLITFACPRCRSNVTVRISRRDFLLHSLDHGYTPLARAIAGYARQAAVERAHGAFSRGAEWLSGWFGGGASNRSAEPPESTVVIPSADVPQAVQDWLQEALKALGIRLYWTEGLLPRKAGLEHIGPKHLEPLLTEAFHQNVDPSEIERVAVPLGSDWRRFALARAAWRCLAKTGGAEGWEAAVFVRHLDESSPLRTEEGQAWLRGALAWLKRARHFDPPSQ